VIVFRPDAFAAGAASRIIAELATAHQRSREHVVSIMLAGGSTPRDVYSEIARVPGLPWQNVAIWFGDERAVPSDHPASNHRMAMDTLLAHVPVLPGNVHRMEAERDDLDDAARAYERTLPESIDILLLGVGRDGHTASIFPDAASRDVADRDVVAVHSTAHPHARLTITPRVIRHAATCIVLAATRPMPSRGRSTNGPIHASVPPASPATGSGCSMTTQLRASTVREPRRTAKLNYRKRRTRRVRGGR
jgi:6-phosphogluconolactonase